MPDRPAAATDRLDALLDAAVDAIVLIDPQGRIARFNRAAETLFGYRAAEVLGENVRMLMPAPYREEHDGYIGRYLETAEPRIIGIGREVTACRRDGSRFPIDLSVGEFRSGDERGFVGILRDISERHQQQAQLHRNAEELRLLFEQAPAPMAVTDPDGLILRMNSACQQLLGYPLELLHGTPLVNLVAAEDRAAACADFDQLREGASYRQRELRMYRRDGVSLPVLLYAAHARDAAGNPLLQIVEILDRSALHAATREAEALRERLAHAGRLGMLGEMVSGIAHEVNQPLTAIHNYASACRRMVTSGQTSPEELAEVLEKISRQAERAGQVIRGLRSMIRARETTRDALSLNALVEEVSRLVELDLQGVSQRLLLTLSPGLPTVLGDGVQIQQVLMNLIRNGLEAMREAGRGNTVEVITAVSAPGWVDVVVRDQGPGLAATVEARLFDPFVTTKSQGMGLGLSICKSIVQAHGGELRYRPADEGGATFTMRLPQAVEDDEEPA